jgi:hypothetical protein
MSNIYTHVGVPVGAKLPKYTSIGCYPLVYIAPLGGLLCAECAQDEFPDTLTADVLWEGAPVQCEQCDATIESAYGEVGDNGSE